MGGDERGVVASVSFSYYESCARAKYSPAAFETTRAGAASPPSPSRPRQLRLVRLACVSAGVERSSELDSADRQKVAPKKPQKEPHSARPGGPRAHGKPAGCRRVRVAAAGLHSGPFCAAFPAF